MRTLVFTLPCFSCPALGRHCEARHEDIEACKRQETDADAMERLDRLRYIEDRELEIATEA